MDTMNELWQKLSDYSNDLTKAMHENPVADTKQFTHFFVVYQAYVGVGNYRLEAEEQNIDPLDYFIATMEQNLAEKEGLVSILRLDPEGTIVNAGMIDGYKAMIDIATSIQAQ